MAHISYRPVAPVWGRQRYLGGYGREEGHFRRWGVTARLGRRTIWIAIRAPHGGAWELEHDRPPK